MSPRYFRTCNEGKDGEVGYFYCEVVEQCIMRMINAFEAELLWATPTSHKSEHYDFTDQPEFLDKDLPRLKTEFDLIELTPEEFEHLWMLAQQ